MLEQPDPQLIRKSSEGDTAAFREIVTRCQEYVFALAFRLLRDEGEAEDAVQEVFVRVWRNLRKYQPERRFTTWLYSITTNHCLDRLRRQKRHSAVFRNADEGEMASVADPGGPGDATANMDLAAKITSLAGRLSPKQELVFVLRDLQDLSVSEVCEITGMSRGSVKVNLHLARKAIREKMSTIYGEGKA